MQVGAVHILGSQPWPVGRHCSNKLLCLQIVHGPGQPGGDRPSRQGTSTIAAAKECYAGVGRSRGCIVWQVAGARVS